MRAIRCLSREDPFHKALAANASDWLEHIDGLSSSVKRCRHAASSVAESNDSLIKLLDGALEVMTEDAKACPVCEQPVSPATVKRIHPRLDALRKETREFREARSEQKIEENRIIYIFLVLFAIRNCKTKLGQAAHVLFAN